MKSRHFGGAFVFQISSAALHLPRFWKCRS
jgi:hypothetical protein